MTHIDCMFIYILKLLAHCKKRDDECVGNWQLFSVYYLIILTRACSDTLYNRVSKITTVAYVHSGLPPANGVYPKIDTFTNEEPEHSRPPRNV